MPRAAAVYKKKLNAARANLGISATYPIRPRPGARRVCPPQRRTIAAAGSGWRSKCAGLVDAGAVGGDLVDDVVGGQNG